jgi:hypothetical protein
MNFGSWGRRGQVTSAPCAGTPGPCGDIHHSARGYSDHQFNLPLLIACSLLQDSEHRDAVQGIASGQRASSAYCSEPSTRCGVSESEACGGGTVQYSSSRLSSWQHFIFRVSIVPRIFPDQSNSINAKFRISAKMFG